MNFLASVSNFFCEKTYTIEDLEDQATFGTIPIEILGEVMDLHAKELKKIFSAHGLASENLGMLQATAYNTDFSRPHYNSSNGREAERSRGSAQVAFQSRRPSIKSVF